MGDHAGGAGRISAGRASLEMADNATDYQDFANDEAAMTFMNAAYGNQVASLSADEVLALKTWSGAAFSLINEGLRNPRRKDYQEYYRAERAAMETAFANPVAVLQHDLVTRRSFGGFYYSINQKKIGTVLTDKGYTSVTTVKKISWAGGDQMVEIRIPKGTRALWISRISVSPDEGELLLKRGTSFKIVGKNGNTPILEVIGQA